MNGAQDPFRVLIIGAGSGGLLIAQALKKQGIKCVVFEQDAALDSRPRDWNFAIYWAQVPLEECLPDELNSLIETCQVDSHKPSEEDVFPLYNGQSGELMKQLPAPYNIRLQRRKLLRLISKGIDIRASIYGKRLARVESDGESPTAFFEDGSSEVGDLVIGAEGAHSKVREYLLGPEKAALHLSPCVGTITIAKLPEEAALKFKTLHGRHTIHFHPHGYFSFIGVHDATDDKKPGEWTFMIMQSWLTDNDTLDAKGPKLIEDMKRRGGEYGEPFKTIFESIPDDSPGWHKRLSYWVTEPWDSRNGTLTLVGDAAHPMTFHRGGGLNNAIHDVASLARQLKKHGTQSRSAVLAAISGYEQEMWPRGKKGVIDSNENTIFTHDWAKIAHSPLFSGGVKQDIVLKEA